MIDTHNPDKKVYKINGYEISFFEKNGSLEPYYKIISKMISLRLEGNFFDEKFVLMPNIRMLFVNSYNSYHLVLSKNIISFSSCSINVKFLPKNLIFLKLNRTCDTAKLEINKNMKYVLLDNVYHLIIKSNKNMIQYDCINSSDYLNMINKKLLYLQLGDNRNGKHIDLPKKLISLVLNKSFNKPIILTSYIKCLFVKPSFNKHIFLEYPVNILKIQNDNHSIIENIPNGMNERFVELCVKNTQITNNMPNDVGKKYKPNYIAYFNNIPYIPLNYGCIDNFQNLIPNEKIRVSQIYSQLVSTNHQTINDLSQSYHSVIYTL